MEEDAKKRPAEKLDETGRKTLFLAEKFRNHHNPEVALLTACACRICPNLSQRQKKDLRKFVSP
jgi:hypothetical protein